MSNMKLIVSIASALFAFTLSAQAEFYLLKLKDLNFENNTEELRSSLKQSFSYDHSTHFKSRSLPNIRVPSHVSVYLAPDLKEIDNHGPNTIICEEVNVAIDISDTSKFHGFLDVSKDKNNNTISSYKFNFDPSKHKPVGENQFSTIKGRHYDILAKANYIGTSWFQELSVDSHVKLRHRYSKDDSFSLFTSSQLIADNLALHSDLNIYKKDTNANIPISDLDGITLNKINWSDFLPEENITLDPLASMIPEDQHVLISPSLAELDKLMTSIEKEGSSLVQSSFIKNPFRSLQHLPPYYRSNL